MENNKTNLKNLRSFAGKILFGFLIILSVGIPAYGFLALLMFLI